MKKLIIRMAAALPYALAALTLAAPAYAAAPPQIVTGAVNLLTDVSNWLLLIVPAGAGAMLGYHAILKQLSDGDPSHIAQINQKMRNVLVAGAIAESAVGLTRAFLAYFQ